MTRLDVEFSSLLYFLLRCIRRDAEYLVIVLAVVPPHWGYKVWRTDDGKSTIPRERSALTSGVFLHYHGNWRNTDGMKTLSPNMTPFAPFDGLPPLNKVDQTTMKRLTELADRRGWSVENVLHEALEQWVAQREAERELETKIVKFPTRLRRASRHF